MSIDCCRGFLESCDKIQINTDGRSSKIEDIKHCPFGEICWYFTDSWEQFRLNGSIDIIDGSNSDPVKIQALDFSLLGREQATGVCLSTSPTHSCPIAERGMSSGQDDAPLWGWPPTCLHGRWKGSHWRTRQREKAWFASSLNSRYQYLAPSPGLPSILEGSEEECNDDLEPSAGPVSSFCLLVFDPEQVDYLNVKSNERVMFKSKQNEDGCKRWMSQKVNP
ncbi:hypothetical protein Taro_045325 [Colocasia esculenta]|uniref:pyridoxal 5'-phosphate synthase n=1 Tax=Colocasia esculenta TaxID=4460 RepID=A0A843WQZ4_COLES|nr:hypothetical protein [Colocasia esculenta]